MSCRMRAGPSVYCRGMRHLLLAVTFVALAAAACGGGEDNGDAPVDPTQTAVGSVTAPTVSAEGVPEGWAKHEFDGVAFWTPPDYVGGPMTPDPNPTISAIGALGAGCAQSARSLQQATSLLRFAAVDSDLCAAGSFVTNVNTAIQDAQGATLDSFVNIYVQSLPSYIKTVESARRVHVNGRESARISASGDVEGATFNQAIWILPDRNVFWVMIGTGAGAEFNVAVPVFEQMVALFEQSLPD